MKGLWDERHPILPEVSSKYLRTQVTLIISKKLEKRKGITIKTMPAVTHHNWK